MTARGTECGPLVVAEDELAYRALVEEFTGAGWRILPSAAEGGPGTVTVCSVADEAGAGQAVLAALRSEALLVRCTGSRAITDDLVEDLARVGPVLLVDEAHAVHLDAETWRLLHELRRGATVASATAALHLSLRTGNRRIAEARLALRAGGRAQLVRALGAADRIPPAPVTR